MTFKEIFVGKTEKTEVQMLRNIIVEVSRIGINFVILWLGYEVIMQKSEYMVDLFGKQTDLVLTSCTVIASMLSGIANYIFSTIWVFHKKKEGNNILRFIVFTLIGAIGLAINAGITVVLTKNCGMHYLLSNLIAQIIVFFFNFFARKYIVYTLMSKGIEESGERRVERVESRE